MKQGIFYPELTLGAGALSAARKSELRQFLVDVVRQRRHPLHLANLWNALYFNYDLAHKGFRAGHLEPKRIPTRTAAARDFSLPVGGFVRVHTEMACGDLLAEVIYKEGAHPSLDESDGWVDPLLSGAPASVTEEVAGQPVAVVRERFVLDLDAFGPDGNAVTTTQYLRLCENARWLDSHGHLIMEAMYGGDEAELDDLDYYARYLIKEHRDGLLAFCFHEELTEDEVREALLRSFEAVRELALDSRELRSWRDKYFFLGSDYREKLADKDAVLGGGDLQTISRGLARVPSGKTCVYSTVGQRIVEMLEHGGLSAEEEALVRGAAYVTAVCQTNTYVTDTLTSEQRSGVLPDGVHLRLDDDWQGGGVWRAERVPDPDHYALKTLPPAIPLGLGYSEATAQAPAEAAEIFSPEEEALATSQTGFHVALTRRDRALGRLRLSSSAAASLADGDVDLAVRHADQNERYAVEREGDALFGVRYPLDMHPGIVLWCNVESQGSVVRLRTKRVTPPIETADGKRFDFDTSIAVYERELGLRELKPADKRGAPSLTDLINRAFRKIGHKRDDGARTLTLSEIMTAVIGPGWAPGDSRLIAAALSDMGLERDGTDYVWHPRVTRRTRSSDRSLLAAYGEVEPRGRIARAVRRHWVPMHLRHYTRRRPSPEKRASYAAARQRFGMHGVLPDVMPDNCTWVEPYSWGDDEAELTMDELEIVEALELADEAVDGSPPV